MPRFVGPAAEEALCCALSLTPLVSNLRQYLNIHYSEFHFSALFFFNLKKERKTRLATVSYILQERNEPLQSCADLLDKYIFRHLGTLSVYDLAEK